MLLCFIYDDVILLTAGLELWTTRVINRNLFLTARLYASTVYGGFVQSGVRTFPRQDVSPTTFPRHEMIG